MFGNGDHQGYFVIVAMHMSSTQMTAVGDVIALTLRLELKEWVPDAETNLTTAPRPDFTPIAIVPAPGGEATTAVTYSGASGVAATIAAVSGSYIPTLTGGPGVSPILADPVNAGRLGETAPDDVPASVIVRTQI